MTTLKIPADGAILSLQTETQRQFIREAGQNAIQTRDGIDWLNLERSGEKDHSLPNPVTLTFETDEPRSTIEWSASADLTDACRIETAEKTVALDCLTPGETVYWRVNGSPIRSFRVRDEVPRFVGIDGLSNIRDSGGWKTSDGRRIRYGCIYRGGEMDRHQIITEKGIGQMLHDWHIRTDLDIRGEAEGRTESPLGPSVRYLLCIPFVPYIKMFDPEGHDAMRRIFEAFADETLYPIYYHCWGGADRTGTLAYLLEALLGVSEEDRLLDFELTTLSIWGNRSRYMEEMVAFGEIFHALPGRDDPERAENFLLSCGVTPETIGRLRRNLLT